MKQAFLPIHGYRIYILLFVLKILFIVIGRCSNKTVGFKKISHIATHMLLVVLLTDCLCEVHNVFTTLGDNIRECEFYGIATADLLLDRVDFPGWLFYVLMLMVSLVMLMLESGVRLETKLGYKAIVMVFLATVSIVLANLLNSFSVYEYCSLECEGVSSSLIELLSGLIYGGDKYYLHYAANIVILITIPLYITIVNCVCIPRLKEERAAKLLKLLRLINDVALVLFIVHFIRDTFFWLESYAYAPLVLFAILLKWYLSCELKKLNSSIKTKM